MSVTPVTTDTFSAEVLSSDLPVILDFGADWCPPCRALDPVIERLAEKYAGKVKVGRVNTDRDMALASRFKVQSLPTLVALRGGDVVATEVGFGGQARVEALFQRLSA